MFVLFYVSFIKKCQKLLIPYKCLNNPSINNAHLNISLILKCLILKAIKSVSFLSFSAFQFTVRYNKNSVLNKMNHVKKKKKVGVFVMTYNRPKCFVTVQTF